MKNTNIQEVKDYLLSLQARIIHFLEIEDNQAKFLRDSWGHKYGGGGITAAQFDTVVALPLYNQKKKKYELVLFDYEKQTKRSIYSTSHRVLGLTFVAST